jgi:dipeptidyl aminopeptidase/acylaminoacyl peptidase
VKPCFEQFFAYRRLDPTGSLTFSPDGSELLYGSDASGQFNLYRQALDQGCPRQLTSYAEEAVRHHLWSPRGILFELDRDGAENWQLHRLGPRSGWPAPLTRRPEVRHQLGRDALADDGERALVAANLRRPEDVGIHILCASSGRSRPLVEAAGMFEPGRWHPDGRRVVVGRVNGNTDRDLYLVDVETGRRARLTPPAASEEVEAVGFSADGSRLCAITDRDSEHRWLAWLPTSARGQPGVAWQGGWPVEHAAMSRSRDLLAWVVSEDGVSRLRAADLAAGGRPLALPELPAGVVGHLAVSPRGGRIAVTLSTPSRPAEVYVVEPRAGGLRRLTDSWIGGIPEREMVVPELVGYPTFDGRRVPAWLYRPRRSTGRAPVLVSIHGGPEAQEVPDYSGFYQYLLSRGVAVLAPNIRGSTGYGRAYQRLIYRDWGGGELRDIEAAARHLRSLGWVDGSRLAICGASFGGFAALSALARLPELWAAGVDAFGPSNLITLTRTVPPSWRPLMREWVGDPDEDADMLRQRSPITHVDRIRAPLLVLQGANDARVARSESDQVVDALRSRGHPVEYVVFDDEGHGLTRRRNQLRAARLMATFLLRHLGM